MLQLQLKQSEAIPIELEEEARRKLLALDIEKQNLEETTIGLRTLMADVEKTWHQRYCQIGAWQAEFRTEEAAIRSHSDTQTQAITQNCSAAPPDSFLPGPQP